MIETLVTTRVGRVRTLRAGPDRALRAVLCWPGLGLTAEEFHRLLREGEARGVAVLAVDPPGHGRSDPAPDITWEDVAEVARDVTAVVPGAEFLLVGHSAGATALLYGMRGIAGRAAGIVLGDGAFHEGVLTGDDAELQRQNEEWLRQMTFPDWDSCLAATRAELKAWDADVEAGVRDLFATTPDGAVCARGDLRTMTRWSALLRDYHPRQAPRTDRPALALWAAEALSPEPEGIAALRQRVPRLEARCLVGSGHELFWDQPDAASQAVWSFFDTGCDWQAT